MEDGGRKQNNHFDEKPPNPNGRWERKTKQFWKGIRVIQENARLYSLL